MSTFSSLTVSLSLSLSQARVISHCGSLLSHQARSLSRLQSLTVWCRTQIVVALLAPVSITVSGLALSRARAPSLPSLSPEAEAVGPGTGHLRRTLSRYRLTVSPAPSLCSSLPEVEATGPGDSSLPPASFAQPEAGPNLLSYRDEELDAIILSACTAILHLKHLNDLNILENQAVVDNLRIAS
ncbi:hypothetical protein HN873_013223 [Arachis hypogaea]